ncbi:UNVERIFIED_CONTAM: putative ABC transport system ATP-binding protein [Acetivibrio alkalicellulosi]
MTLIDLKNINKTYGKGEAKVEALKNINLKIDEGEFASIMGASGSGKSTLLNIIGCLDEFDSGKYFLENNDITKHKTGKLAKIRNKKFGFIVQHFALIDTYSVYENVQIPLEYAGISRRKRKKIIHETLDRLGILSKINKTPRQLSGGQNQRVAIARALVNNPDIILADEPTGALDKKNGDQLLDIFKELNENGKTIIIVTHDKDVSDKCRRKITITDGEIIDSNFSVNSKDI